MANPHADLGALRVVRSEPGSTSPVLRLPRRWGSRVVLPLLLLGGFSGVLAWASWDRVVPPVAVRVIPVQVRSTSVENSGQELFKANGWIEPRPLPVDVPIQTEGMYRIKEILVNSGDAVKAKQLLIILDDEKAKLDLEALQKKLARKKAAIASSQAEIGKAEVTSKNAETAILSAKEEGESDIRYETSEVIKTEAHLATAEQAVKVEEDLIRNGVVKSDVKLNKARQDVNVIRAEIESARAKLAKTKTNAIVRIRQTETLRSAALADVRSFQAKLEEAQHEISDADVEVRKAQLELDRTKIYSPSDGVVMQLHVRVGYIMGGGGKNTTGEQKASAITLYDPAKLQVRVEVPITKFQFVHNGQPAIVEIEDVLPGKKLQGVVLYDTHFANVARNSVPVKVALPDHSPPQLRPEMIASVRFISPKKDAVPKQQTFDRLIIPRRFIQWDGDQARVWVVDQLSGTAITKTVVLAPGEKERSEEIAELVSGLLPTDKLITSGTEQLKPNQRVTISGEDR
ncbi:MAG TPA: efflux RND transporter periplasmic adaptor subunit [Gemmatales bacterium]|nr:efflux RND transporter periplasmic adaptor subunit [Gemmatales bacterium]